MNLIDSKINTFYTQSAEESRLKMGLGPLEFERNKDLISRHLPKPSCTIADVGGGPGHYSVWLAMLGHQVILIDPVRKHIEQAENRSRRSKSAFRCILAEARNLPIDDQSVDVVILHGPLYHLQEKSERIAVLKEARRVLKIGGVVLGFAITYSAFTLAALQNGLIHHDDVFSMCKEELSSGSHNPPEEFPGILTQAYFHRPDTLVNEFESVGFKTISLLAVEGIAWMDHKYFESWSASEKKQRLMELLRITEADSGLLALSPHIMLAAEVDYLTV
ncbi:class I SAM-dependent methyltransferase [Pedobacter metabolipauper]|uniref:Methyltransferase family protein n=1 Tax=Pedobacter metabolipauper TaxID=425513 RepID=A0A4R6ST54_9SPHI|nr:class I SAM-dependent methyltransferase [Pedobacter metabolipauper]TDQ08188.1 methyltransferase family protein [Pedobacter metabolipauper]